MILIRVIKFKFHCESAVFCGCGSTFFSIKSLPSPGKVKMFWIAIIAFGAIFLGIILLLYYALDSAAKKTSLLDYHEHINS